MSSVSSVSTGATSFDPSVQSDRTLDSEGTTTDESLLPEPDHYPAMSAGGDPGIEIAKLLLEAAHEDKKISKDVRQAEEQAQQAAEEAQLKALESEATSKMWSGVVSGAYTMGSGAAVGSGEEGLGRVLDGEGKIASAVIEHGAGMANLESTRQEQLAGRHKRAGEDARDAAKDAGELVDRTIAFYKEYLSAKSDAQKAAIYRA